MFYSHSACKIVSRSSPMVGVPRDHHKRAQAKDFGLSLRLGFAGRGNRRAGDELDWLTPSHGHPPWPAETLPRPDEPAAA